MTNITYVKGSEYVDMRSLYLEYTFPVFLVFLSLLNYLTIYMYISDIKHTANEKRYERKRTADRKF
jgi:hypothetical protein